MKKFSYEARDQAKDQIVKSTVQANTEAAAARLLIDQGFTPLNIKEIKEDDLFSRFTNRITIKDRIVFTRQLATLIGAGLPLAQSLHTVVGQTENKKLQSVVQDVVISIESGKTLHDSFSKFPEVFDQIYLALVGAGEASGTLDDALKRIADQQEKDAAIMSKIKGALTYPIIVLFVIFAVMGFMLFTVVPQVEKLYHDLKKDLPILTKIMVEMANFLTNLWWLVLIIAIIVIYFLLKFLKTGAGVKIMDAIKLNVPVFGKMFKKLYMGRFMRTSQTLLSTGVSMLDVLRISSKSISNTIIEQKIINATEKVKGGKALSESLENEEYILPLVPQMIKIGEQSGKIDEMMGKTAQVFEDELDDQIKTISTSIEPILMVILAIVAGGMVGAILLPIYSLVNGISV